MKSKVISEKLETIKRCYCTDDEKIGMVSVVFPICELRSRTTKLENSTEIMENLFI